MNSPIGAERMTLLTHVLDNPELPDEVWWGCTVALDKRPWTQIEPVVEDGVRAVAEIEVLTQIRGA